jgi:hypothetical protein
MEVSGQLRTSVSMSTRNRPRYPMNKRRLDTQSWSGRCGREENIFPLESPFLGHPASSLMPIPTGLSFVRKCITIIFSVFTLYLPVDMMGFLLYVCVCACVRASDILYLHVTQESVVGRRQHHLNRKIQEC